MPSKQKLIEIIRIQTEVARLGNELSAVMDLVVRRTLPLLGADGLVIELAEGAEMVYRAASGIAEESLGLRLDRATSLSGQAVARGEALYCSDTETDPRVDRAACRRIGARSMIVLPLLHGDTPVGVLKAISQRTAAFGEEQVFLLELLSGHVAATMFYAAKYDLDELFRLATHDTLTRLANRALFMDRLRSALFQAGRDARRIGLMIIDLDGLKAVNDGFGHRAGDALITTFAARLKEASRQSDTVARLGGDEFSVLLNPIEGQEGLIAAERRLRSALIAPLAFEGHPFTLRASVGHALVPEDGFELEALIETADQRMYAQKRLRYAEQARD